MTFITIKTQVRVGFTDFSLSFRLSVLYNVSQKPRHYTLVHVVLILLFAVLLFNGLRCAVLIVDTRKWSIDPV